MLNVIFDSYREEKERIIGQVPIKASEVEVAHVLKTNNIEFTRIVRINPYRFMVYKNRDVFAEIRLHE